MRQNYTCENQPKYEFPVVAVFNTTFLMCLIAFFYLYISISHLGTRLDQICENMNMENTCGLDFY